MTNLSADVVVIGGGITGVATAYALALDGVDVVLIERFGLAAMASGWTLAGVRQSGRDPAELPLAQAAVARWAELDRELEAPTGYRRHGNLRLARTPDEVQVIRRLVDAQRRLGLELDFLPTTDAVLAHAPALAPTVLAAAFCPTDGSADPVASVEAFAAAARRHGARLRLGQRVVALEVDRGRLRAVATDQGRIATSRAVLAAGAFGNELLAPHHLAIPLTQPMVTVLLSEPLPPLLGPVLGVANADMAGRQDNAGRLRVTSGASDWHGRLTLDPGPRVSPTAGSIAQVVEKLTYVLPAFRDCAIHRCWAGLLDLTPDGLPVLDHVPGIAGLTAAMGFSGHGFALGPVSGALMASLVQGKPTRFDLTSFRFDRFDQRELPDVELTLHG